MSTYNPNLVTMIPLEDGQPEIAVITVTNITYFNGENGESVPASSLLGGLKGAQRLLAGGATDLVTTPASDRYCYEDGETTGLLADQAHHLLDALKDGTFRIKGVGKKGVQAYERFCDALQDGEVAV
jgi:hypothetical protein